MSKVKPVQVGKPLRTHGAGRPWVPAGGKLQTQPLLVGKASETTALLNGVSVDCLVDTGSMVSTISQSYYNSHLQGYSLRPLHDLLEVRGATGSKLPYLGYVEVPLTLGDLVMEVLLLVVPDTEYNKLVPLLVGTNVLTEVVDARDTVTDHVWREALKNYALSDHVLGSVKTSKPYTVNSNARIVIRGVTRSSISHTMNVVTDGGCSLPGGLILVSSLQKLSPVG